MSKLTTLACRTDPRIRERATAIAGGYDVTGPSDFARAVEQLARDSFRFVDEPDELLIDPVIQFDSLDCCGVIYGDCDDSSMFTAALMRSLGLQVRFKAIQRASDGSFTHVFSEYYHPGFERWIPIDPTIKSIPVYDEGDFITEEI